MFCLFRGGIRHHPLPAFGGLSVPMQSYGRPDGGNMGRLWGKYTKRGCTIPLNYNNMVQILKAVCTACMGKCRDATGEGSADGHFRWLCRWICGIFCSRRWPFGNRCRCGVFRNMFGRFRTNSKTLPPSACLARAV